MRWQTLLSIVFLIVSGCGFNTDEPVYDTASNPDGFPPMALTMLEDIQSGQLRGFDAIAGAFGDLYTEHTDLLDSQPWRLVIDRLGSKFSYTADSLRELGIASYREAAEYYQLASFARPQDKQLYERALTFETWRNAFDNAAINLASIVGDGDPQLVEYLAVARYFLFGGESHREFYEANLRLPFRERLKATNQLTSDKLADLDPADRCLVSYLNLTKEPVEFNLASYEDPSIDLAACRVTQIDSTSFIAEAYIRPREAVSGDFTVALRMSVPDSITTAENLSFNRSQLQLRPEEPTSEWKAGSILAAARQFDYPVVPCSLQVSMIDRSEGRAKYLELADGGGSFFHLGDSAMVAF